VKQLSSFGLIIPAFKGTIGTSQTQRSTRQIRFPGQECELSKKEFIPMVKCALTLLLLVLIFPVTMMAQAPTLANAGNLESTAVQELKTPDKDLVVIQTNLGTMTAKLYPKAAPKMVAHFKKLVREGFYNGLKFHRVIPNFMIQGGDYMSKLPDKEKWGTGRADEETVPGEFHSELHHAPGIVAAARKTDPNSASTQFYICVGAPNWLDGQYTIFGELTDEASLEVAKKISEAKRDAKDRPEVDVVMQKVYLKSAAPTGAEKTSGSKSSAAPKTPQTKQ
jgi:cyclophilin family peptidyl-prolyl cis-trans isomerase